MNAIHQHQMESGLWLVAEPIIGAQSLAMTWLLPAGYAAEAAGHQGTAAILAEMIWRGAGERDAKAHSDALDHLGVDRGSSVEMYHICVYATMVASKFRDALPLLVDTVRRPSLPASTMEPCRDLVLQDLDALEDEPQRKVFFDLHQQHFPEPFRRTELGKRQDIENLTLDQLHAFRSQSFVPNNAVISFAGKFDWEELRDFVEQQFGDWFGSVEEPTACGNAARGYLHQKAESAQVHIALAYDTIPVTDPRCEIQRVATAVLSGGMSGRLFTQVREKRGLCYAVHADYVAGKNHGVLRGYAGTTAARAQETLNVLTAELGRLSEGIEQDEYERAIVGLKSSLIMQGESTTARARAIAADQFCLGRPRSLEELANGVNAVTLDKLNGFVDEHPPGAMTIVTVGPKQLAVPN